MKTAKTNNDVKRTVYDKIVNVSEDGEITVLNDIFEYPDGMKGATGSKFYAVSKEEYEEKTDRDEITEYLIDSGMELPENFKRGGFNEMVDAIIANNEEGSVMFDQSYIEIWDYLRKELKLTENEAFIFNCVGGGRCFDKNFKGTHNKHLHALIRKAES